MDIDATAANNNFTALTKLIANLHAGTTKRRIDDRDPQSVDYEDDKNADEEDLRPLYKRARINETTKGADYIPRFTRGVVGRKYVVVKGLNPGIYANW